MRLSLLMSFWLLGLGGAGGMMGVAFAQATADQSVPIPLDGIGVLQLNPSALTFPVAFILVGWMAIRSLPSILKDWEPTVRIEHVHVLKDASVEALSRRDLEEILGSYLRERDG